MVPIPESRYSPSLDKCLTGELLLLSWKSIFSAIQDTSTTDGRQITIEEFLSDQTVLNLLSKPFDAFPPPNSDTKAAFEGKTSAINVTPSPSLRYDIKQVKDDSIWLSNVAKIDEISALRIVVQECQARTSAKLLGRFTEDELASIRESAGNSNFSSPITVSLLSRGADSGDIQAEFETEGNRRQRILTTYLSERRYLLTCAELLLKAGLVRGWRAVYHGKGKEGEAAPSWLEDCGEALVANIGVDQLESLALRGFSAIETNVQNIGNGSGWFEKEGGNAQLENEWTRTQITEATHTMEMILEILTPNQTIPSSHLILGWLRLLQNCGFFDQPNIEDPSLQSLVSPLQAIAMVVTIAMFNVKFTLDHLYDLGSAAAISSNVSLDASYIQNTETISEIHEIVMHATTMGFMTAGPAILAWVCILKSLHARVEENKTLLIENEYSGDSEAVDPYQPVVEQIMNNFEDSNVLDFLAQRAVDHLRVLDTLSGLASRLGATADSFFSSSTGALMRCTILDLVKGSHSGLGYLPEVIEALLSTLFAGQNYWDLVDSTEHNAFDPVTEFLQDGELVEAFLWTARGRYPCEPMPFLRLIHAIAAYPSLTDEDVKPAISVLNSIPQFTFQLPEDFRNYTLAREDENSNMIVLQTPLQLFEPRLKALKSRGPQSRSLAVTLIDRDFCIPAGTEGRIISDSGPKVVTWYHEYSGLKYLGKLLETYLTASDIVDGTTGLPIDRDSVIEIIQILATLLLSSSRSGADYVAEKADAQQILETASSGLNRNHDITTVIFEIFEDELQRQSSVAGSDIPLGVLVSCLQFIHAMLPVAPSRVWPLLARSGLLGVSRGGGRLASIVESVELVSGNYDFLISCIRLYEALVEDISCNAIKRRSITKSPTRFNNKVDTGVGIPDQLLSKTLLYFTRYLIDVLESSFSWKFGAQNDRRRICKAISTTFDKVLRYVHGIETSPTSTEAFEATENDPEMSKLAKSESKINAEIASKITGILISSASQIADSFLSTSSSALKFQPLLVASLDALETPDLTTFSNELGLWTSQVTAVLGFSKTLLRVSSLLERSSSQLEMQLFQAAPLIARLYAVTDVYKKPVVLLFESLIVAANNSSEPPSLLGHLGPRTAKNFLQILSDLDKPISRDENVMAIWHLLSMVVSNKQQWFANYLLAGKTPRDVLGKPGSGTDSSALDKPLLTVALERLCKINEIPQHEALVMLEFVALSQNFWPWTVYSSPKHGAFITAISEYAGVLHPLQQSSNIDASIKACFQTRIAAYIAEILAMHIFHSRQTGTNSSISDLVTNLDWFIRFAVSAPKLNSSLHTQLKRNFEARYPGCTPYDLKRTTLEDRQLGKGYFYDLPLADKMLLADQAWTGRRNDGLRVEFEHANVNLSLVDSHIALFHGWKVLAIEISSNLSADTKLQKALIRVCTDCLTTNSTSSFSEDIFARLNHQRADFALILAQRLVEAKCTLPEMKDLLTKTWETIRNFRGTFERALRKEDAPYYRSLLKLLFIAIRAHALGTPKGPDNENVSAKMERVHKIMPVILDIIKYVVAMGLRECAATIHDDPADSTPEDISLITGILQSCLRTPSIELSQSQIVATMLSNDTARVATTLFSWSDRIAVDGDPIYGELSILFLLELSSLPMMAEQLAIDGLLGHIAAANITSYLRRGNVSPFADGAGLQRCYSIWARGILPLLLNLLDSVQESIAAEVATFLNQFSPLLTQSTTAFEAPESSRTSQKAQAKYISLSMCSELHSLALINFILNNFRQNERGIMEIPEVKWDSGGVAENVEFWLGARGVLRERIVPMGSRDQELAARKTDFCGANSRLEEAVVQEMMGIRNVLSGGDA
ncbi:nucleoporin-like protein [Halenospora varia]|nr:nucleoporin-like protein [Halenospora varia]